MTQITADLTSEQRRAIDQIEKLMRVAGKTQNEVEAATFAAKAQDLLTKFNLDMSIVEQNSGASSGKREDTKFEGGLYHYQRDVWEAVAQLNFCMYWNQYNYDKDKTRKRNRPSFTFQHRVVGRTVNVVVTKNMADYLLSAIERVTRERYPEPSQFFTRSANSFREGLAETVIGKIYDRRRHLLKADMAKERDAKRAAEKLEREGVSTATGLTLSTLRKSEHDANTDFIYGEGTSAKWAAQEATAARRAEQKEAEYTVWAKAHPEEAAAKEAERRKERRRGGFGRQSYRDSKPKDYGAYYDGQDKGKAISIDPQAERSKSTGYLTAFGIRKARGEV